MNKELTTTKDFKLNNKSKYCLVIATVCFGINMIFPSMFVQAATTPNEVLLITDNSGYPTSIKPKKTKATTSITAESSNNTNTNLRRSKWVYTGPKTMTVPTSAYSSTVDQCDASPFITASGYNLKGSAETVVAANFLPLGTRIKIPSHFGDKIFTVEDRMNARYTYKVDIWMTSREKAIHWGVKNVTIEILD